MANSDKNIRISTNRDTTALPKITFTGQVNSPISLNVLDDNTLSFEGSSGQLFSINNVLSTGYIFSINDISGIPSFRVNADGTVGIAEFLGNVGIGLTNPAYKVQIAGSAGISGTTNISGVLTLSSTTGSGSTSTGALVVSGGVGIGGSIFSSSAYASSLSGVVFNNGAITNTGTITSTGVMSISNSSTTAFSVRDGSNNPAFTIDTIGDIISLPVAIASTSTSSGSLVVAGGVGIGGTLNVGGSVNVSNSLNLVNTTTGIATTWIKTELPGVTISNLAYANNLYVGVGASAVTSTDGINWTVRNLPHNLTSVAYGNGIWSGIRSSTAIVAYSTDGFNWTETTVPTGNLSWVDLTFGGGYFVAIADGSSTAVCSTDGINWSTITLFSDVGYQLHGISYGNGYFYITFYGGGGIKSRDLVNWSFAYYTSIGYERSAYNNGTFAVIQRLSNLNTYIITNDFTSVTQINLPGPQFPSFIIAGDRNFIAGSGQTLYTFPIPNNSVSIFPNTTGEINNVEIGNTKPASGSFSNIYSQGLVAIGSTVRSISPYTGALVVNGGVGIGGSLYVSSATAISGVTINAGVITGNLTGTASTATYAHQSGYGISSGTATTATYAHQSGYATTSGIATTANYSYQSGYGITAGLATTATYSIQSGYAITSGSSGSATTASNLNVANASTNSVHTLLFSSLATGSGVAVSSNTTLSYNPSTNVLSTSGLAITSTTASTSTATGALQVAGGVGISGRLSFNQASFGTTGISINPTMAMIGNTGDPIFMSVLEDNTISFEGSQGQLFSITPNLSTGYIYSVNDITGIPLIRANANANVTANEYAGNFGIGITNPGYKLHVVGSVGFTSTTTSTSTSTGTLVVSGGVGIGGSLNVGSASNISSVILNSGTVYGNLTGTATTATEAITSNAIKVTGSGSSNLSHFILFTPNSLTSGSAVSSYSNFYFNPSSDKLSTSNLFVSASTAATSYDTGALVVTGGVGIGGSLFVNGDLTINGTTTTINSVTLSVDDKNIELGSVASPSDLTAEGGGITLRGSTDKNINWYTGVGWSSSESWNLVSGSSYKIDNTNVLTSTTLGTGVTNSSLTSVGTITSGTWAGTTITAHYGGTGLTTPFTVGDLLYANTSTTWARLTANSNSGYVLTSAGSGATPVYVSVSTIAAGSATTSNNISLVGAGSSNLSHRILFTPNSSSSGSAVSSDSTFAFNPSTEILSVSGLAVTSTTSSTGYSSGALLVSGGVGIAGTVNILGDENVNGRLFYSQSTVGTAASSVIPSIMFVGQNNNPITLSVLADNTLSFEGSSGQLFSINNNLSSGTIFSVNDISGIPIIRANANGTLSMGEFTGTVGVGLTNPSFKFQVSGSAGFSGTVYVTGNSAFASTTASTSTSTGALTVSGGVGVGGSLYVNSASLISSVILSSGTIIGNLTGIATTASYAYQSGYGLTSGLATTATYAHQSGYGITAGFATSATSASVANTSYSVNVNAASANSSHYLIFSPSATGSGVALSTESALVYNPSTDILSVSGLAVTSSLGSTSTSNGALRITGGVGIGGSLYSGSILTAGRLQNQSFSGSSLGSTDGRSSNTGALIGHGKISYGNGIFVTNSSWGAYNAAYSTDGTSWTASSLPVNQGYPVNFYGDGYFVLAASGSTTVLYSTNGSSWSQVSIGNTFNRTDGAYGNGKYIIVGTGETYNYSTNLTTWTSGTLPSTADWRIAYGNGTFVALGYGTRKIIYSYDGIYWNIANTLTSYASNWTGITYGNGKFIVSSWGGGGSAYSLDGINWYQATGTGGENLNKVSYGNGLYFVSSTGSYYPSTDGITYSTSTPWSVAYEAGDVVYGLGKFQALGRYIDGPTNTVTIDPKFTGEINNVRIGAITPASGDFTNLSSTGSANLVGTVNAYNLNIIAKVNQTPVLGGFAGSTGWTSAALLAGGDNHYALSFGNGLFVQIRRTTNHTSYSPDGKQWVASTMPFTGNWSAVVWGQDKFVAVAGAGTSGAYSSNGISWTSMNMPSAGWNIIAYGDDKFVALGNTTTAAYSSNGITWSGSSIAATSWAGLSYGNGTFVAVSGIGRSAAYSYDGINWNLINLPTTTTNWQDKKITYGNGYFVVTTYNTSGYDYSRDGINWSTVSVSGLNRPIVYGNGVYAVFNYSNAFYSYDVLNWQTGNTIAATDWIVAAYGNNRIVATSYNTNQVGSIDGPSNTLNLHPKFTGDIDNVRIGAKQPGAAEFTNLAAQQPVRFTANTTSLNTTTGALVVVGGVGIGGSLYTSSSNTSSISGLNILNGSLSASTGTIAATNKLRILSSDTSAFVIADGSNSAKLTVDTIGGIVTVSSSTASTSTTTGALVVTGGVGIGGSLNVNSTSSVSGVILSSGTVIGNLTGLATTATYSHQSGYAITSGSSSTATTATYSHQSGYAITSGSASSSSSASIANTSYNVYVNAASANSSHYLIFSPTATGSGVALSSESALVYNPSTDILSVSGLAVTSGTASTSSSTGALVVTGGVGIGQTLTVGLGVSTPVISAPSNLLVKPGVDSTTGIQFTRSSTALPVLTIDTLNSRVGIGLTNPEFDLEVNGSISATTKSFVIEHPTKEGMKLRYGSLEGPENGVYIRGKLINENEIIFPDYWSALIDPDTITVHITPIGDRTIFVKEIKENKVILGARLFQKIHCYYSVWAERKDVPKLKVEF